MTISLVALSYLIFIAGMYTSKLIVSEMMGVLQVSYFGLFYVDVKYPMMPALNYLRYTNGFNDIFAKSQGYLPNRVYEKGFDEYVFNNLNIMVLLIVAPLVLSAVFAAMFKYKRRMKERNLSYSKLLLGEWSLVIILFFLYNLSTSTITFILFNVNRSWLFEVSIF